MKRTLLLLALLVFWGCDSDSERDGGVSSELDAGVSSRPDGGPTTPGDDAGRADGPVMEMAVRLIPEAGFNTFAEAYGARRVALEGEPGVRDTRLFRTFFSGSASDVPAARVGLVEISAYDSVAAHDAARSAVDGTSVGTAFADSFELESEILVRLEGGGADLSAFDGASLEIAVRDVDPARRDEYDAAQAAFLGPLEAIGGAFTAEFEVVRAAPNVTAGFSTYANADSLQQTLTYYTTDTLAFTFFGSFDLVSSHFGGVTEPLVPITLPDAFDLNDTHAPEDIITFEHTVYVSDIANGEVLAIDLLDPEAPPRTFVASPGPTDPLPQTWGLRVDEARRRLLVVANVAYAFDGVVPVPAQLRAYDLDDGELVGRWDLPAGTVGNAVLVDDDGRYYVGDIGTDARIVRVDPDLDEVSVWADPAEFADGGFGLGGLIYAGGAIYGIQAPALFFRIPIESDGTPGPLAAITATTPDGSAFTDFFADGMSWADGSLYYAFNDAQVLGANGVVYRADFSDPTTATITPVQTGLKDPSGITATRAFGEPILLVNESQLGHAFGVDPGPPNAPYRVLRFTR